MRRLLTLLLLLVCAALGSLLWHEATRPIDTEPIRASIHRPTQEAQVVGAPGRESRVPALANLSATRDRPLFAPNRRLQQVTDEVAPERPQHDAQAVSPGLGELTLVGTMRLGASRQRALIRTEGRPVANWFEVGSDVAGWRLEAIDTERVIVSRDQQRAVLPLFPNTQERSNAQAAD